MFYLSGKPKEGCWHFIKFAFIELFFTCFSRIFRHNPLVRPLIKTFPSSEGCPPPRCPENPYWRCREWLGVKKVGSPDSLAGSGQECWECNDIFPLPKNGIIAKKNDSGQTFGVFSISTCLKRFEVRRSSTGGLIDHFMVKCDIWFCYFSHLCSDPRNKWTGKKWAPMRWIRLVVLSETAFFLLHPKHTCTTRPWIPCVTSVCAH